MGQCLIFHRLSFPFTISRVNGQPLQSPVFQTPGLELGVTRHAALPQFSESPRAICKGHMVRTGPKGPTFCVPLRHPLHCSRIFKDAAAFPPSVPPLQASSTSSSVPRAKETHMAMAPPARPHSTHSPGGRGRGMAASPHTEEAAGTWGPQWAPLGPCQPGGSGRGVCSEACM